MFFPDLFRDVENGVFFYIFEQVLRRVSKMLPKDSWDIFYKIFSTMLSSYLPETDILENVERYRDEALAFRKTNLQMI